MEPGLDFEVVLETCESSSNEYRFGDFSELFWSEHVEAIVYWLVRLGEVYDAVDACHKLGSERKL